MMMNNTGRVTFGVTLLGLLLVCAGAASAQESIPLWPEEKLPNSKGLAIEDSVFNERIYQIKYPEMYTFFPAREETSGAAVLIFPGGGYHHLTYNWAGFQVAKWFNSIGVTAFVVNYRLPNSPDLEQRQVVPLQDAQRAMRIVRANAHDWNIDPEKVGVMGRSAGGHLVSTLGTHQQDVAAFGDSLDSYSYRPNFMIMVSPVISLGKYTHEGSRENLLGANAPQDLIKEYSNQLQVTDWTPPAFLVHAANDEAVPPQNSLQFYHALLVHGVSSSIHIFPQGGHEIGLVGNPGSTQQWTDLCEAWLREMGFTN
ncbi:alpha/beta hydrolase [Aliifodinibius sp. S!AR15-10]|uniref:alpha/beta hydrolase n=1 Tax=Aliifodinibius sp. S!AR15-10 TaxID=2950437 RepID=UPI002859DD78|nr:alpha/beta hydrolase [Aliifodinibius sp. S!AR15-10]MDR8393605.1 alpha/beta hydrolase [Aliifodinibius sp. S!AR15-10]